MSKLLQINICLNLSTGKIAQQIGETAITHGWDSWIAYSGRFPACQSKSHTIKIGTYLDASLHYTEQRFFDNEGLYSKHNTKELIKHIEKIHPDIIMMHNIHDHWMNYPLLFKYFATLDTPIVWVQHDCWAFTGGCMYFDMLHCDHWKSSCKGCPDKRTIFCNQAERNLRLKTQLQSKIKSLTFVSVSDWIADMLRVSNQKDRAIVTIHNGIDLSKFRPVSSKKNDGKFRIIGVASTWDARKGLFDFIKLRDTLPSEYIITLVGLTESQIKRLPEGINGMTRTNGIETLAVLYSESDVFVNTTYSDNFPTVNLESLACGTPIITYKTGGSPEAIDEKTGVVIEQGNVNHLAEAIKQIRHNPLSSEDCRKRAEKFFDKDSCFEKYFILFSELLKKNG